MKRDQWLLLVAAGGGALIWALIVAVTGKREAWDSSLYFSVGVPLVCVLAATLGFVEPRKPGAGVSRRSPANSSACC
jgi:hypothetical protein